MTYNLVIDIGSSRVKVLVFEAAKGVNPLYVVNKGYRFIKADLVFNNLLEAIKALPKAYLNEIDRIVVTGLRSGFLAVDKEGRPLLDVIPWYDNRAQEEAKALAEKIPDIFSRTGLQALPYYSAPKILWIRQRKRGLFQNAKKYLLLLDYIIYRLTDSDKFYTDPTIVNRTLLYNIRYREWDKEILDLLDIEEDKLPVVLPTGSVVGELNYKVRRSLRIGKKKIEVVIGGGDQQLALYALSDSNKDELVCNLGSGGFLLKEINDLKGMNKSFIYGVHTNNKFYIMEGVIINFGLALDKFLKLFNEEYRALKELPRMKTDVLVLPFFSGRGSPSWNPKLKGLIKGITLWTSKLELIKASLEGLSFEVKQIIEAFERAGHRVVDLKVTGGLAMNDNILRVLSDVTGRRLLKMKNLNSTALGGFLLSLGNRTNKFRRLVNEVEKVFEPTSDEDLKNYYEKKYDDYLNSIRAFKV